MAFFNFSIAAESTSRGSVVIEADTLEEALGKLRPREVDLEDDDEGFHDWRVVDGIEVSHPDANPKTGVVVFEGMEVPD